MTLDELRDWHAKRKYLADVPNVSQITRDGWDSEHFQKCDEYEIHPFPPTLDAADASFPPKWRWTRDWSDGHEWWAAFPKHWDGEEYPTVPDTGDKVFDLYALSKLAWEQEESNEH